MIRYAFMGSPEIARVILERVTRNYQPPVVVISQAAKATGRGQKIVSTPVAGFAKQENLALIETDSISAPEDFEKLKSFAPELILVVAFGQILKSHVLDLPPLGCLNLHASLLPLYRGAAPIQRAIWDGQTSTGVSVQKMVPKLDAGDVVVQKQIPLLGHETSADLFEAFGPLGAQAFLEALELFETKTAQFTPQDPLQVSMAPKIKKEEGLIDWSMPADFIERQVRALQPWPIAQCQTEKESLKVFRAQVVAPQKNTKPGEIETDGKDFLHVICGHHSALALLEVQPPNRKRMPIADYLRGFRGSFPFRKMIAL